MARPAWMFLLFCILVLEVSRHIIPVRTCLVSRAEQVRREGGGEEPLDLTFLRSWIPWNLASTSLGLLLSL